MPISLRRGDLVVAPPAMRDARFTNAVIMITEHTTDGTMGLCLNRPLSHYLHEVVEIKDLDMPLDLPLYWGGPVGTHMLCMMHDSQWSMANTRPVNQHWSVTSHPAMFHRMAAGDKPTYFRTFVGYTGWASGQLAGELTGRPPWTHEHSWLVVNDPDLDLVYDTDEQDIWHRACRVCADQAVSSWL
jgi:putative transcriptional regulator